MSGDAEYGNAFVYDVGATVGNYLLEERLGGNQQLIFRGVDIRDQKIVVIKVFVNSLRNEFAHKAYYNEIWARDLAKSTPGVLKINDKGVHEASEYFVTEYIETGGLLSILKQHPITSLKDVLLLFSPIADTIDALHKHGVIHRDIKPENILARKREDKWEVFIIDFGDARFSHEPDGTYVTNSIAGTAQYIAPEVFTITPTTILVDNYSFGVMLYTALEGKAPFNKSQMPSKNTDSENELIPYPEKTQQRYTKGVADLILWAMSYSSDERPKTLMEIIELFKKIDQMPDENDKKWIGRRFKNYIALDILYKGRISPSVLALDLKNSSKVVLKTFIKDSLQGDARLLYENELNSLIRLDSEHNIILPKETFEQDGIFFIVTGYQDGGSLRDLLKTEPDIKILIDIFIQIGDAIDYIHKKGLVHRDIKPENIVYRVDVGKYHAYLTDFGIAKILDNTAAISFTTQYQRGTGPYMAPEIWLKDARKTKAIDVYAFGVMLYEAFEGRLPFTEKNPDFLPSQHINEPVPAFKKDFIINNPKVGEIILGMLEKNPNARPKSLVKEMKKLRRLLTQPIKEKAGGLLTDPNRVTPKEESFRESNQAPTSNESKKESPEKPKSDDKRGMRWLLVVVAAIAIFVCVLFVLPYMQWPLPTTSPTPTITFTPTSFTTFPTIVSQASFCHNGPNESYLGVIDLGSGTMVEILGMNSDGGDWFMIRGADIDPCWIKASRLTLSPDIDFEKIYVFTTVFTIGDTTCLEYPGVSNAVQTIIPTGRRVVLYGRSDPDATWVMLVPDNSTNLCWVKKATLGKFDPSSLPFEVASLSPIVLNTKSIAISSLTVTLTVTNQPVVSNLPTFTRTPRTGGNDNTPNPPPTLPSGQASNTPVILASSTPVPPSVTQPPPPTPIPPTDTPEPTPTLCWPPGKCK